MAVMRGIRRPVWPAPSAAEPPRRRSSPRSPSALVRPPPRRLRQRPRPLPARRSTPARRAGFPAAAARTVPADRPGARRRRPYRPGPVRGSAPRAPRPGRTRGGGTRRVSPRAARLPGEEHELPPDQVGEMHRRQRRERVALGQHHPGRWTSTGPKLTRGRPPGGAPRPVQGAAGERDDLVGAPHLGSVRPYLGHVSRNPAISAAITEDPRSGGIPPAAPRSPRARPGHAAGPPLRRSRGPRPAAASRPR